MAARSDDRTPIAMLKPEMYRRRIRGRITKLWTAHSTTDGKKCSHDFIFVDKENTAIEDFIRINDPDVDSILQQVQEGLVYELARGIQNSRTRRSHPTDGSNETFKSKK